MEHRIRRLEQEAGRQDAGVYRGLTDEELAEAILEHERLSAEPHGSELRKQRWAVIQQMLARAKARLER